MSNFLCLANIETSVWNRNGSIIIGLMKANKCCRAFTSTYGYIFCTQQMPLPYMASNCPQHRPSSDSRRWILSSAGPDTAHWGPLDMERADLGKDRLQLQLQLATSLWNWWLWWEAPMQWTNRHTSSHISPNCTTRRQRQAKFLRC